MSPHAAAVAAALKALTPEERGEVLREVDPSTVAWNHTIGASEMADFAKKLKDDYEAGVGPARKSP